MKEIILGGRLGKIFGRVHKLDVQTPAEAIRALCSLYVDFETEVRKGQYRIFRLNAYADVEIDEHRLHLRFGSSIGFRIDPVAAGAGSSFFKVILGGLLIGAAFLFTGGALGATLFSIGGMSITGGQLALVGGMLALSGVSQLLTPQVKTPNTEQNEGYVFDSPGNRTVEGGAVPLVFGKKVVVGSTQVAMGIFTEEYVGEDAEDDDDEDKALQSLSTVKVIDLVSAGPIGGLSNGNKSIFINDVPLMGDDGKKNFRGIKCDLKTGTAGQSAFKGIPATFAEIGLGTKITTDTPITFGITDSDADAALIKVRCPSLITYGKAKGTVIDGHVELAIDVKTSAGSFVQQGRNIVIDGHTTAAYERQRRVELPTTGGGAPWTIRVRRITPDNTESNVQNDTYLSSYTIVYDAKITYRDSAVVKTEIDARLFGNQIPKRTFELDGIIGEVPNNWNPNTRNYTGVWDGGFQDAVLDHPVWVLWYLMTNRKNGLGERIAKAQVDKWTLHTIAQYCDGLVPDASGGWEPRFVFRGVLKDRTDAVRMLDTLAACFRGMIYWSAGSVSFTQDAPQATDDIIVAPANMIKNSLTGSGSALQARHSSIMVQWQDHDNGGVPAYEVVQRDASIQTFGDRQISITAIGAATIGQAQRVGEWLLDTEDAETDTYTWEASFDHAYTRPGKIASVNDPTYAALRMGGRIVSAAGTTVIVDRLDDLPGGSPTYQLAAHLPNGSVETRNVNTIVGTTITLASGFSSNPIPDAMFSLIASNLAPRRFRVVSMKEKEDNKYEVTALFHDPTKYARVERGKQLPRQNYTAFNSGPLKPPHGLNIGEYFKTVTNGRVQPWAHMSWRPPGDDPRATGFEIQYMDADDKRYRTKNVLNTQALDVGPVPQGRFKFRVRTTGLFVDPSKWVEHQEYLKAENQEVSDILTFNISVNNQMADLVWTFDETDAAIDRVEIRYSPKTIDATWNSSTVIGQYDQAVTNATVIAKNGTYLIKAVSYGNRYSKNAKLIVYTSADLEALNVVVTSDQSLTWPGMTTFPRMPSHTLQDPQEPSNDFRYGFWAKYNTTLSLTAAAVPPLGVDIWGSFNETIANAKHGFTHTFDDIHDYQMIVLSVGIADLGGRMVEVKIFDDLGNSYTTVLNPTTGVQVSSNTIGDMVFSSFSSTYLGPSLPYWSCTINVYSAENMGNLTVEVNAHNGATSTYVGDITKGFECWNFSVFTVNQTLDILEEKYLTLAPQYGPFMTTWSTLASVSPLAGTGNYRLTGFYDFRIGTPGPIEYIVDLGYLSTAKFYAEFDYTVDDTNFYMSSWGSLEALDAMNSNAAHVKLTPQVRFATVYDTDTFVADWTDWKDLTDETYQFRFAAFRVLVETDNALITPKINSAIVTVDMEDRILHGNDINCPAGGMSINYPVPFMAVPAIAVNGQGMATGDYSQVTAKTIGDFTVRFFNAAGTGVARTFDWIAKGYGKKLT